MDESDNVSDFYELEQAEKAVDVQDDNLFQEPDPRIETTDEAAGDRGVKLDTEYDQNPNITVRKAGRPKGSKNKDFIPTKSYPARGNRGPADRFDEQTFYKRRNGSFICLPENLQEVHALIAKAKSDSIEPQSYKEAINGHESTQWKQAMDEEVDALEKNKTWDLVSRPQNDRILKGKWVYKIKRDNDDRIVRFKARWVVKGYEQLYRVDYD